MAIRLGLFSNFINYGSSFLLLPIFIAFLNKNEIGLWYFSLGLVSLNLLLDLGLQVSFTRYFSYAKNGVRDLSEDPVLIRKSNKEGINYLLLGRLISSSLIIYLIISFASSITIALVGFEYSKRNFSEFGNINFYIYWAIISAYCFFQLAFQWVTSFLTAFDRMPIIYKSQILSKTTSFILIPIILIQNYGLISIPLGLLVGQAIQIFIQLFYFTKIAKEKKITLIFTKILNIYKVIFENVAKIAVFAIAQYLLLRANIFFVTEKYGLAVAGDFGIIFQIGTAIWHISKIKYNNTIPIVVEKVNNGESLKKVSVDNFRLYVFLYVFGLVFFMAVLMIFPSILKIDLDIAIVIAILIFLFFEGNTSNYCMVISYTNKLPYVKTYLISSIVYILIVLATINIQFSLIYLIFLQITIQSLYNYWYWPYYLSRNHY